MITIMKNKSGRSFVTITIVIALMALFLRIAVERIIKITISQNESGALATLKLISTALENYAKNNVGIYPVSLSVLTQTRPPYLDKDYITLSPFKGYAYSFSRLEPYSYSCQAAPVQCNLTGRTIYTIIAGGSLMSEECAKKES